MSLDIAIDAALKRGANPVSISRLLGVSIASIEKRADALKARVERMLHARRIQQIERECGFNKPAQTLNEFDQRDADLNSVRAWLALPIRYDNDPRSHRDGAIRVNLRLSAHARTLGGVADYSSKEAA